MKEIQQGNLLVIAQQKDEKQVCMSSCVARKICNTRRSESKNEIHKIKLYHRKAIKNSTIASPQQRRLVGTLRTL